MYVGIEPAGSGAYLVDTGEGDGTTATLTLSRPPVSVASILVIVQGIILPTQSYSLDGVTLTFDTAPADGEVIEVRHLGMSLDIGTPTASTVGRSEVVPTQLYLPVQQVITVEAGAKATSTTIPHDDTIPTNTEGDEVMTVVITPKHADNILVIEAHVTGQTDGTGMVVTAALYQDSISPALQVAFNYESGVDSMHTLSLLHRMVAGSASAITFKIRCGPHSAGEYNINSNQAATRLYGGVSNTYIMVTEYLVTA